MEARLILGLCDRFSCLPSQVRAEGASVLRLVQIEALARPPQPPEVPYG